MLGKLLWPLSLKIYGLISNFLIKFVLFSKKSEDFYEANIHFLNPSVNLTPSTYFKELMQENRYTATAIVFHWLLALLIIGTFSMGLYMADLPLTPQRIKLYNWHKWAGVTILALSALRLLWRLTHPAPALPKSMPTWQIRASHLAHLALYILFFAVPLIGWAYSSAAGFPIVWLGILPLPDWVPKDRDLAEAIKPLHEISAWVLAAVVLLHIGAALKHHFINRDGVLARMLPTLSKKKIQP